MSGYTHSAISDDLIRETYIYLLARMIVVRQEHMDRAAEGFAYNQITYNPLGSADFVNPNFDVAYLEAWIAVDDQHAALLEVPVVEGRYYTAQILDEWGEVICNINDRATPTRPSGTFALVKPGANPPIPEGATRIDLHSSKAKLLGRVELRDDPDGAVVLQKQFRLTAPAGITVADPHLIPMFDNATLMGAEIFEHAEDVLSSALDISPVAARMQVSARAIADLIASDPSERARIDAWLRGTVAPEFKVFALTEAAPYVNHWIGGTRTGSYGADYRLRTMANYVGLWANVVDEVIYFVASRDAEEQALDGSQAYQLHFGADALPDAVVDGYWSVILVGIPDYRVAPNSLNRFNFNSYSPLAKNADGSLTITVGPALPEGALESNWLPSPAGKAFSLTFRAYVPRDVLPIGSWSPPAVTKR